MLQNEVEFRRHCHIYRDICCMAFGESKGIVGIQGDTFKLFVGG